MSLSYVFTPKMTTARILVTPVPPNPRLYIIQTCISPPNTPTPSLPIRPQPHLRPASHRLPCFASVGYLSVSLYCLLEKPALSLVRQNCLANSGPLLRYLYHVAHVGMTMLQPCGLYSPTCCQNHPSRSGCSQCKFPERSVTDPRLF